MDRKIELSIFGAIAVILVIVCIMAVASVDKEGPKIEFDKNEHLTYVEGQDDKVLLAGVKAVDAKDGDVTDTLFVAGKIELAGGQNIKITYAAKDKKNNVTKTERIVSYVPTDGSSTDTEGQTGENQEGQEAQGETTAGEGSSETEATEEQETTTAGSNSSATGEIDKAAADADGIPVIKLTATEGTIKAGQSFDAISYVRETYDNSGDVSRRIRVTGDYDTKTPGDYHLEYVVSDTDGNVSQPAAFTLHVTAQVQNTTQNNATQDNSQQSNTQQNSGQNNAQQNNTEQNQGAGQNENAGQNSNAGQDANAGQNANAGQDANAGQNATAQDSNTQ